MTKIPRRKFLGAAGANLALGSSGLLQIGRRRQPDPGQPRFTSPAGHLIPFNRDDLVAAGPQRVFEGAHLNEIAFPLGGIGTGTVSLGGRGNLRDWEIFNRPNKGSTLPRTFVALWAREDGGTARVRVVEAPISPPYAGAQGVRALSGIEGLPRLHSARFQGSYPLARVDFADASLPVRVALDAFTPFIPHDTDASALPVAVLRYTLTSTARRPVNASLAFSLHNVIGFAGTGRIPIRGRMYGRNLNEFVTGDRIRGLRLTSSRYQSGDPRAGSLALVTDAETTSHLLRWPERRDTDALRRWLDRFTAEGRFEDDSRPEPSANTSTDTATLTSSVTLQPGQARQVTFVLAWYFPVREMYWSIAYGPRPDPQAEPPRLRNHYGDRFADAWQAAEYTFQHLERLERDTRLFHESFFGSTLPAAVLDAASSQVSIIRSNTCLLLSDRQFFAFEGCEDEAGCCPLNCTHVWNYAQAPAYLFPDLERHMRRVDFKHNLRPDGSMAFRTLIPLGTPWTWSPAADGQMGSIARVYREWQLSGDSAWLRDLWPEVKRALEFAWVSWDADRDGVIEGEQHNTYDIEFYGANSMVGSWYLAALRAAEIMAGAVGDADAVARYRSLARRGAEQLDRLLWNGEYYVQQQADAQKAKYQFGAGCLSDQLVGQWFATIVGLGDLLPRAHVDRALAAIYRYNFRHDFADFANMGRVFALNDEKGLLLCSWPKGNLPDLPFYYANEVWTGIEYQVAAHLIAQGLVEEGLAIVRAARDRHDGLRRNPWSEVECGSHYVRAMASWSLLLALSGYAYSAVDRWIRFAPRLRPSDFRCFYATGGAWGVFTQRLEDRRQRVSLAVRHGSLDLVEVRLGSPANPKGLRATVSVAGRSVPAQTGMQDGKVTVRLAAPVALLAGETLTIDLIPT